MTFFKNAQPIFYPGLENTANAQVGFHTELRLDKFTDEIKLNITGRNLFRLYVNGAFVMQGPARTAHGYARVDSFNLWSYVHEGNNDIAVEVVSYGNLFGGYSNDCTLESAMMICEITDGDSILSYTGSDAWKCHRITERDEKSERIAHCRQCAEAYHLTYDMYSWINGGGEFTAPEVQNIDVNYLPHNAKRADLEITKTGRPIDFGSCRIDEGIRIDPVFFESWSQEYFDSLEERPLNDCKRTVEEPSFNVSLKSDGQDLIFEGDEDKYALFDLGESHVGFFGLQIEFEYDGILDVVHTEILNPDGSFDYQYNTVTRLHIPAGIYDFLSIEPVLARYLKLYMRTPGSVIVHSFYFVDYFYPDEHKTSFLTSDEDLNRLYGAAKRTLLLNTMDIFMDCPERERGGWLCDSLWTSRAAALMLSDTSVEREFLENYLLTDKNKMWNGFFPEVYPGSKSDYSAYAGTGITTWSFWLMCELCEFVKRTGDIDFAEQYRDRVEAFVNGSKTLIGKSGLLENLPNCFIDWSLANTYTNPISVPANSLYAYMLKNLAKLYNKQRWAKTALEIRKKLRNATEKFVNSEVQCIADSLYQTDDGKLVQKNCFSEAALYTSLWSGLWDKGENRTLDFSVVNKMGPAPKFGCYPTVGKSGLFIGLCIRLDMLARRGEYDKMLEDLKAIYMQQLTEGPGTLWENPVITTSSRCHGFTSHAGVHLMRDILGIADIDEQEHIITIAPHPCGLRWAHGTVSIGEQLLNISWKYDGRTFELKTQIPEGYFVKFDIPKEIEALGKNNVKINYYSR